MAELQGTASRTPISITNPNLDADTSEIGLDDPRLTKALLKASMGHQALSPADEQVLNKVFGATSSEKLSKFLSIKEDNFTDSNGDMLATLLDLNSYASVPSSQIPEKRTKFIDEVLELEKRLKTLLVRTNYDKSGIKEKIYELKAALKVAQDLKGNAVDTFSKEVDYRLGDRARLNPEKKGNDILKDVKDDEIIALTFMGIGATEDPKVLGLFKTPVITEEFKATNLPKTDDAQAWLAYLSQAQADGLPAIEQRVARSLLRKLRDLEEESDTQTFIELAKYLPIPPENIKDHGIAQRYQDLFNQSIRDLKSKAKEEGFDSYEYNSDQDLVASLDAMKIGKTEATLTKDESVTLGRAFKLLDDRTVNSLKTTVVQKAIAVLKSKSKLGESEDESENYPGFASAYESRTTDKEKEVFLKQVLRRIAIDSKEKEQTLGVADVNPVEADPIEFYQDFCEMMEYLHAEINDPARSEANRNNLKKEFERFFSSGNAEPLLAEFNGQGENPELATALNLFRYDKKNLGLIKSLFNKPNPESETPVFNIIYQIRDPKNKDLNDIAQDLEVIVLVSGRDDNASQVPSELVDTNVSVKTDHAFSGDAFNPEFRTDKETKEPIPQNSFPLFNRLGINKFLTSGKIKLVGGKMMMITDKETKEIPENLRTLLDATLASKEADKEMSDEDLLNQFAEGGHIITKTGNDEYTFHEDSQKGLIFLVATGASARHEEYVNYDGYNADTKVSYEKLMEQRTKLIALSNKHGLGIFEATPVLQPYYRSEYRDSLMSLAINLPHLRAHYDTNIRPYKQELNDKGERIQIPHNVKSSVFGIDPSQAVNVDINTSALDSPASEEIYTDVTRLRALTREIFDSFLEDDHHRRPSFNFNAPIIRDDYSSSFGYRLQPRPSRFSFLFG